MLVYHADEIDAKFNMMASALADPGGDPEFTSRDNPLRRSIFRGLPARSGVRVVGSE
jgi:3'-5' exoribonuclease